MNNQGIEMITLGPKKNSNSKELTGSTKAKDIKIGDTMSGYTVTHIRIPRGHYLDEYGFRFTKNVKDEPRQWKHIFSSYQPFPDSFYISLVNEESKISSEIGRVLYEHEENKEFQKLFSKYKNQKGGKKTRKQKYLHKKRKTRSKKQK
jgi:hypothetical protein